MEKKKLITVITPAFEEEENLDIFYQEVSKKLLSLPEYDFEVILIDDGSKDNSWAKIIQICRSDNRFNAIRFSRNFGAHIAITAGVDRARGDAAIILACDLQDPIETAIEFLNKWKMGCEIVWGSRISRQDSKWRIVTSNMFNHILRRWAMPKDSKVTTGSFILMDRKVIDCFKLFDDHSRLTFAIVAWTGFRQEVVKYHRVARKAGRSGWTFSKMVTAFYNAILAYSTTPLKIMTTISLLSLAGCIPITAYIVYLYLAGRTENIGWISTMLAIIGFGGLILLQLSVTGEYLSRVYKDASRRPLYFVSEDTISGRFNISRPDRRRNKD